MWADATVYKTTPASQRASPPHLVVGVCLVNAGLGGKEIQHRVRQGVLRDETGQSDRCVCVCVFKARRDAANNFAKQFATYLLEYLQPPPPALQCAAHLP